VSEIPQLKFMLLPPAIWARLSAKADSDGALPINLSTQVIERLTKDPVRADRLSELAAQIWDHLSEHKPGWGPWPESTEDALAVGMLLSVLIGHEANEFILELSEEQLAVLEEQSREQGLSLEQIVIESITQRVEGQADHGEQWKGIK
jgi:hypothetical protein